MSTTVPAQPSQPASASSKASRPIGIIGVTRGCGFLTTLALVRRGKKVRALTRSKTRARLRVEPKFGDREAEHLEYRRLDITSNVEAIAEAISGCSAVIFAASSSDQRPFGIGANKIESPEMVDGKGLANLAEACVREKVKKLIVISTYDADRKWLPPNILLDLLLHKIVKWKVYGEEALKSQFNEANTKLNEGEEPWSYIIVRPSWLRDKEGTGPARIFARGRVNVWTSSFVSRQDVSEIVAEAACSDVLHNATFDVTTRRGNPHEGSWIDKGKERKVPATWKELLEQVEPLEKLTQKEAD